MRPSLCRIARSASLSWVLGVWLAASGIFIVTPSFATPCVEPKDCASKFCVDGVCCDSECKGPCEACSAASKGSGNDGTCGLMKAGSICDPAHCDETSFSFVGDAKCDAAGTCIYPLSVNCLNNNPCQFDLCGDNGCEVSIKNDGTDCGGGKECVGGVCGGESASSSAASSSSSGAGGAGGEGGSDGGAGESGSGGSGGYVYPPAPEDPGGCSCRAGTNVPAGGGAAVVMAGLGLLLRRRARLGGVAGRSLRTR
jgi:MYXO-CTERM domain-containing protein